MLSKEYQRILDLLGERQTREMGRTREERLAPVYERVGLRSPQVAQTQREDVSDMVNRLSDAEVDLMLRQVQRGESLEDIETQRQHQVGMHGRQTMAQMRHLGAQHEHAESMQERAFEEQRRLIEDQRKYQEKQREQQEKEQRKSMLTNLLVSTGLGIATGGIGAATGLLTGAGGAAMSAGQGALMGGLMGGGTTGQMVGYGMTAPRMPQQQQDFSHVSPYLAGGQQFRHQYSPLTQTPYWMQQRRYPLLPDRRF